MNGLFFEYMKKEEAISSIVLIASMMNEAKIEYIVGGSGALLVHGVDVVPNDIDVLVGASSYMKARGLLSSYALYNSEGNFAFKIGNVPGELIEIVLNSDEMVDVVVNGVPVKVNRLEDELVFYRRRTDKVEQNAHKIRLIEEFLLKRGQEVV